MKESRDYLEMAFRSIACFSDDGKLSVDELEKILNIAQQDGVVDDNEKRVLSGIIKRLNATELTLEMQAKVAQIRSQLNL